VLEIGPGSTPHNRSDAFLELDFDSDDDKLAQRGGGLKEGDFGGRTVHYYRGGTFPFQDNQFDYVICSHVIEHVDDPESFLREIFRVGNGRGYLEYPLITYEYLYDFRVHLHFVKFDFVQNILRYLPKRETAFQEFAGVSAIFYRTLECGWNDLCVTNKNLFFEGVEFERPFAIEKTTEIDKLLPPKTLIIEKKPARKFLDRIANKFGI
jgi:SAM-dependent methyltransferase